MTQILSIARKYTHSRNWKLKNATNHNKLAIRNFFCIIPLSFLANPVPATTSTGINFQIGDDKANWEALYNATQNNVGRSDDQNIFDKILSINARERGTYTAMNYRMIINMGKLINNVENTKILYLKFVPITFFDHLPNL